MWPYSMTNVIETSSMLMKTKVMNEQTIEMILESIVFKGYEL